MNHENNNCLIERVPSQRTWEYTALAHPEPARSDTRWPIAPGAVRYDALQRPILLHPAPARWLAPDPSVEIRSLLEDAVRAASGTVAEVTGKWDALLISGTGASRLLACAISIDTVLAGRDCAAVTLFDCPAVIARRHDSFALWVQSSYTTDFLATAERLRASLGRNP
jgi:sarcosine oxidase gamma subunit